MTGLRTGTPHWRSVCVMVLLSAVFIAGCVFWILYFPFHPALVLRVVPPDASVATWHRRPVDRVAPLLRSAPAAVALAAAGIAPAEAAAVLEDPDVRSLLQRLGGTGATLAYAPRFGAHGKPALLLGAWVGGLSTHMMRGGWLDRSFSGFRVHRFGRDRIWTGVFPELPDGLRYLSFGVYEGVLAGCASPDPFGAASLIFALKRHGALPELVRPWLESGMAGEASTAASDLFRVHLETAGGALAVWSGDLHLQTNGAVAGRLVLEETVMAGGGPAMILQAVETAGSGHLESVYPLPEAMPAALAAVTLERVTAVAGLLPIGAGARSLLAALTGFSVPGAGVCVWVAGGDYSGRIMRLKVPSAGFALQVPAESRPAAIAAALADALNTHYGAGLIAVPDRQTPDIYTFRPVKDIGGFAVLGADERPALAVRNGWLIGMSSVDVLRRVLDAPGVSGPLELAGAENIWMYGQAALPALGEVTVNAQSCYALMRLMQTGTADRLEWPTLKRVLEALASQGTLTMAAGHDPAGRLMFRWAVDAAKGGSHE